MTVEEIQKNIQKNIIERMMVLRNNGDLKKTDFVVMAYLLCCLDGTKPKEIKQKNIVEFTYLPKSDVSKSIKRLISTKILIKSEDKYDPGFKLNNFKDKEYND